jgi:hypothetical protein
MAAMRRRVARATGAQVTTASSCSQIKSSHLSMSFTTAKKHLYIAAAKMFASAIVDAMER